MNLTKETAVTGIRRNSKGQVVAFSINRKTWGRGSRGGALLKVEPLEDSEGNETDEEQINMCCLGIYARACRVSVKRIQGKGMPSHVNKLPKQMQWTLGKIGDGDSRVASALAAINDKKTSTDASKELKIAAHFAKQGIKVRFVGKG